MKKIVHIVVAGYVEGCAYQENILPQKHKELGFDVYIIASQFSRNLNSRKEKILQPGSYVNKHGVRVIVLHSVKNKIARYFYGYRCLGLYDQLCSISPDIIFLHDIKYKENKCVVKYAKKHKNVVVYADNHCDYYNNPNNTVKQRISNFLGKRNAKVLDKVLKKAWGTTPWRVDYLKDFYHIPSSKVDLLVMGGDEREILRCEQQLVREKIRKKYGIPNDAFLIVTGGIIDKRKNQELLMKVVSTLNEKNIWLLVFGSPDKDMRSICDYYSLMNNIVFAGWVSAEESTNLFLASNIAVFPGTHSVLWEQAAACGLPEIIKHWSGMEHVNVNDNVIFLNDNTENSLYNAIEIMVNEYDLWAEKARKAASYFYYCEIAKKSIELN